MSPDEAVRNMSAAMTWCEGYSCGLKEELTLGLLGCIWWCH